MDENKRKKLQEIGFKILPTCGICTHSVFPNNEWGTCSAHKYDHLKHTGDKRQLSIHMSGHCNGFELDSDTEVNLEKFKEFLVNE